MPNEQLLFLPKGTQIPTAGLLAKTNTHLLNPTELQHHGRANCREGRGKLAEMDKAEGLDRARQNSKASSTKC